MAGYSDTRQLIIDTLMGRPAGTEIQPEDHQAFALALNDYIRSVELVSASGVPIAFAEPDTVPVQPDNGQAVYLSSVGGAQTVTFSNFIGQDGSSISVTSTENVIKLVTLLWNGQYWSSQVTSVNAVRDTTDGYLFMGIVPSLDFDPGEPDQKVFYLAESGQYLNFNSLTVSDGYLGILKYDSNWTKEEIFIGSGSRLVFRSIYSKSDVMPYFRLDVSGNIVSTSVYYKIVKLHIPSGKYQILNPNTGSLNYPALWKYTDNTYTTPEKQIIGGSLAPTTKIVSLEDGYYIFAYSDSKVYVADGVAYIFDVASIEQVAMDISEKAILQNVFSTTDVLFGQRIISGGSIQTGISTLYKLVKLYLPKSGYYWIAAPANIDSQMLWKYTDNTYSITGATQIIGTSATPINEFIYLESGYYVFSFTDSGVGVYNQQNAFMVLCDRLKELISNTVTERTLDTKSFALNSFAEKDVMFSMRLTAGTGVIASGSSSYKIAKMYLSAGKYWLHNVGVGSQDMLWKYTDNTYTTPEKQIIGNIDYVVDRFVDLESGYYAIGWLDGAGTTFVKGSCFIGNFYDIEPLANTIMRRYGVNVNGYSDFEILNNGWSISNDKKSATSLITGIANALRYNNNTFEEECNLVTGITPLTADSSGYYEFVFGKQYALSGTAFGYGKDSNGDYLSVYHLDSETAEIKHKFYFSGLNTGLNKRVIISIEKRVDITRHYDISIMDMNGKTFSKNGIGNFQDITGDSMELGNGDINGGLWGKIIYYSLVGTCKVDGISFGYPLDINDVKLAIFGHSFVEGSTMNNHQDKKFASLLKTAIGNKKVAIMGRGGGGYSDINSFIQNELKWLNSCRYVFIFIGANDEDNQTMAQNYGKINRYIIEAGMIPIWANIPPRYPDGQVKPILNAYIENNFNYIDIASVFYNADGTINRDALLGDNLHPSQLGHQLIFNCIKFNCGYLFNI